MSCGWLVTRFTAWKQTKSRKRRKKKYFNTDQRRWPYKHFIAAVSSKVDQLNVSIYPSRLPLFRRYIRRLVYRWFVCRIEESRIILKQWRNIAAKVFILLDKRRVENIIMFVSQLLSVTSWQHLNNEYKYTALLCSTKPDFERFGETMATTPHKKFWIAYCSISRKEPDWQVFSFQPIKNAPPHSSHTT